MSSERYSARIHEYIDAHKEDMLNDSNCYMVFARWFSFEVLIR